jgi:hypothetical protein
MFNQQTKREPTAQEKLAHFQLQKQQEYQQQQELMAQAQQEAAAEQVRQTEAAERAQLEARRQQRLERETLESLTPDEVQVYEEQTDPNRLIGDLAGKARQREEDEFLARVQREYEQELRDSRPTYGTRAAIRTTAEIHRQEKLQAFQQERDRRELRAEIHDDPINRAVHGLSQRAQEILLDMTNNQPSPTARAQTARETVKGRKQEELKISYLTEMQNAMQNGYIPRDVARQIQAKYTKRGLDVTANDVISSVTQLRR